MTVETDRRSWEHLRELATSGDRESLDAAIGAMEPDEAVRAILRLEPEDQQALLTTLSPPEAADIIEDAPDEQAADPASDRKSMGAGGVPDIDLVLLELAPEGGSVDAELVGGVGGDGLESHLLAELEVLGLGFSFGLCLCFHRFGGLSLSLHGFDNGFSLRLGFRLLLHRRGLNLALVYGSLYEFSLLLTEPGLALL